MRVSHGMHDAQRPRGVRRLLAVAPVYSAFQAWIGAHGARARLVSEHIRPRPGERVLDLGCGTGEIVEFLSEQKYVGFDPNASYIEAARARFGHLGEFSLGSVSDPPVLSRGFDVAIAIGVLHHLDDPRADALIDLARVQLRPGGRLVTLDPVFVAGQHPVARALARWDRGRYVRSPREYAGLAGGHFESVQTTEHHDYLRVPYSHLALECM